jgi:hypothetical protein
MPTLILPLHMGSNPRNYLHPSTDKMASRVYTISIGMGHSRPNTPQHWILITYPVGSFNCTYYHTVGGHGDRGPYKVAIEANKRLDSFTFASVRKICYIPEVSLGEVIEVARSVKPAQSQRYALDILMRLESKGVVPDGSTRSFEKRCGLPIIMEAE